MPGNIRPTALGVTSASSAGPVSTATALAANARARFTIQNQSTAVLVVKLGSGASTSDYHYTLQACTGAADGKGGILTVEGYQGIVSVASSGTVSYTAIEFA